MKKLRSIQLPYYLTPLVFLLVLLAAFGPFLPLLGFYQGDWAMTLLNRLQGPSGFLAYFGSSRPLTAWVHTLLLPALGESVFNWQVFALLMRWLAVTTMWWCFSDLWPRSRRQVAFAALLFAVYPAFTQQAMAVTNYPHWLQYSLFFFSLGLMVRAQQSARHYRTFTALALAASLAQLAIAVTLVGLELVRPVVLWLALGCGDRIIRQNNARTFRLGRTIRHYLPYGLVLLIYAAWFGRIIQGSPLALQPILAAISSDLLTVYITSWAPVLDLRLALTLSSFTIGALAAGASIAAALMLSLPCIHFDDPERARNRGWIGQALGLGVLFTLAGILPAWITGRHIVDDFYSNRYALPGMVGASLVVIALLEWLADSRLKKTILLSTIIGLLVVFHLHNGKLYRNLWAQQLDLYWQLYWRAPDIETPTALIFEEEPLERQGVFPISAAISLLYNKTRGAEPATSYAYALKPQYDNHLPDLDDLDFTTKQQGLTFNASSPDTLLVYYDRGLANCLWVVSAQDAGDPGLSELTAYFLPVSNLERITPQPGSAPPPHEIFGPEPKGAWCYYFQKADLARQLSDWEAAAALADEALAQGFAPDRLPTPAAHEWLPFIEGYARAGRWEAAVALTLQAADVRYRHYDDYFCALWDNFDSSAPASDEKSAALLEVTTALTCPR